MLVERVITDDRSSLLSGQVPELEVADDADGDADAACSDNDDSCPLPKGEPLDGHFMCTVDCVKVLCDDNYEPTYETVPCGVKEDVMYKVKVHKEKRTCKFWDDCGAWEGTHGKNIPLTRAAD